MKDFNSLVASANQRLKTAKCRCRIEIQNKAVYLRGTFTPGKQQRIPLKVKASVEGIKLAEAKAKQISGLMDAHQFILDDWIRNKTSPSTVGEFVDRFETEYFKNKPNDKTTRETWNKEYLKPFQELPLTQPLTLPLLESALYEQTQPDTRSRRRYALAYGKLADLAGLNGEMIRKQVGNYGVKSLSPRSLPSDQLISQVFNSLDTGWLKSCFGFMAAYGLRNHEVYHADLLDYPICFVARGKTNERYVWPLYPEWAQWVVDSSRQEINPQLTNSQLGNKITKAFHKIKIPFSPYNLRHAWAVRAIMFGLDISLAASQMGHSVSVHSRIYHHWINKTTHQRAMDILLARSDRPKPPV
ncbi:integrase [Gloeothece verrucosa]|uniref:Integrase family protein n=1 Tax=Gloeothece verrucosa (strain PCC 7822) TaxID=497965 RepID=E0UCD0_GLOV7|nr:integrase [Gloeothece verrucosa]ADN12887.1 integrase family protein [Gloeothece verrucosa PCC 7822]